VRGAISDGRPYRDSYPLGRITSNPWMCGSRRELEAVLANAKSGVPADRGASALIHHAELKET